MENASAEVASQLIPVGNEMLVLPNTAVAEIINYTSVQPVSGGPEWLLGVINWRNVSVPLISYEILTGREVPARGPRTRIAVLNKCSEGSDLDFFAMVTQGIPQLIHLDRSKVGVVDDDTEASPLVQRHVVIDGQVGAIPDLEALQGMLQQSFDA